MEQITNRISQVFTYKYVDFSMNRTKYSIYSVRFYSIRLGKRMNEYVHCNTVEPLVMVCLP
jgi:hypothetical protein